MIAVDDSGRSLPAIATALLLAGLQVAVSVAAAATPPDPESLLVQARRALERGDVDAAHSFAAAIRHAVESDSRWDPDGSFSGALLPDLDERIARMRTAIEALDTLPARLRNVGPASGEEGDPADPEIDLERGKQRTSWVLGELERIVLTIPEGPERGALVQSESYFRAVKLIARDVLPEMAAAVRTRFGMLDQGDERVRAVKTRMDSLKREVIEKSVEQELLENRLAAVRKDQDAYRQVLIEFIGDDPQTAREPASQGLQGVGLALARRIRELWIEVRKLERQSPADHALLTRDIECLRLANVASVADGSRDLGVRIDALAVAVEKVPVVETDGADPLVGTTGCMAALRP